MNRTLRLASIIVVLVSLSLIGCGTSAAPETEPTPLPAATATLVPPKATLTATPLPPSPTPVPPSPTPVPLNPEPGATLAGSMTLSTPGSNGSGLGGAFEFVISEDGSGIASVTFSLSNTKCSGNGGSVTIESGGWTSQLQSAEPVPITNGSFANSYGDIRVVGEFASSTAASGTISISTRETVGLGQSITCDYGTWNWTVEAQ